MKDKLSTTIVFITSDQLHAHDVKTYKCTFSSDDEEFVDGEYESYQEYVTEMINMELDAHNQQFVNAFAMTEEAFTSMVNRAITK